MKIILTENQMTAILETESVAQLLQESFVDSKNIDNLKRIIKRLLITGVAATSIITAINKTNLPNTDKEALLNAVMVDNQPSAVDTVFMQKV